MSAAGIRAYPSIQVAWDRLREHQSDQFDASLVDFARCCDYVESEFARQGRDFYTTSTGYLYELTHFHFSSYKDAFFDVLLAAADEFGLRTVADAGCGIGLDAQALAATGLDVTLYDLPSPSTAYATWRIARDVVGASFRPMDRLGERQHGLVYAVDVLEHVPDPVPFIPWLFAAGRFVCVNLFAHSSARWDGQDMHYPLNHHLLLPEFARWGEPVELRVSGDTVTTLWRGRP